MLGTGCLKNKSTEISVCEKDAVPFLITTYIPDNG